MIKPYNTTGNKITKENSMFNTLGVDYNSHSLEHQIQIYETELILQLEIPNYKEEIKNEQYYSNTIKEGLSKHYIENKLRLLNAK